MNLVLLVIYLYQRSLMMVLWHVTKALRAANRLMRRLPEFDARYRCALTHIYLMYNLIDNNC